MSDFHAEVVQYVAWTGALTPTTLHQNKSAPSVAAHCFTSGRIVLYVPKYYIVPSVGHVLKKSLDFKRKSKDM